MTNTKPKIIAVVGPTASGKSSLALQIAESYKGELINADSRQMYKGFDIGSAKDEGIWKEIDGKMRYMLDGVPEYLTDFLEPNEDFSASEFQDRAFETIEDILSRGKLPILVGGTGYYIKAVIENLQFPSVAPNPELRKRLEVKSLNELQTTFQSCDPVGAEQIDMQNRRKLVRAIEICWISRKPYSEMKTNGDKKYDSLSMALEMPREQLYARINKRVLIMMQEGLVEEVKNLLKNGADISSSAMTAIGYREVVNYIQGEWSQEEMIEKIQTHTRRLARKQLSWFKKDGTIKWVKDYTEAKQKIEKFLN